MNLATVPHILAIIAVIFVLLSYWPGTPLMPVAVILLALAVLFT